MNIEKEGVFTACVRNQKKNPEEMQKLSLNMNRVKIVIDRKKQKIQEL
jgi:hypothetical protein